MKQRKALFAALMLFAAITLGMGAAQANACLDRYLEKNYKLALSLCEALASKNDASALFTLGQMYHNGQGVVQSQNEAFVLFRRAAKLGHSGAQNNLGYYYYNGVMVAQDYKRAFIWFSLAATEGFEPAGPFRDLSAKHLDKDQLMQAQSMAKACHNSHYEMCD
jgi:TPR repeat protein